MRTARPRYQREVLDPSLVIRCKKCSGEAKPSDVCRLLQGKGFRVLCRSCGDYQPQSFAFPDDFYFTADVAGVKLWARNPNHLSIIREYIAAKDRGNDCTRNYRNPGVVTKLPRELVLGKNRDAVLKAIDRLMAK